MQLLMNPSDVQCKRHKLSAQINVNIHQTNSKGTIKSNFVTSVLLLGAQFQ